MKSLKAKLIVLLITMLLFTMLIPFGRVAAANEGVQLIQTTDGNIVVYVDGLEKTEFDYALSDKADATEMELNYINSVTDDEGNQVALITTEDFAETENKLYIRTNDEDVKHIELDFNNMFTQDKMSLVENTTKRISTEVLTDIEIRNETIDGINYVTKVGGLKVTDDQNATYSYQIFDLNNEKYNQLQTLANELNSDYESKTMYQRIEFAKNFYNLYEELLKEVNWQSVENMQIVQPEDTTENEQYIVMIKKVAEDGAETYDVKFMKSYLDNAEEKIQTEVVQETSKLPITGDSIVLFVLLAALVIVAIIVFIRMKKLNKKADK